MAYLSLVFIYLSILITANIGIQYNTIDYSLWNDVVSKYISPGTKDDININIIDYVGISNDESYHKWLDNVANISQHSLMNNVTNNIYDFYAFYINIYNTFTISLIINNPCKDLDINGSIVCSNIKSIWEISPNVFKLNAGIIASKPYSLDEIENWLRNPSTFINKNESWTENPLVHATIVCGGVSCPNVQKYAYGYRYGTDKVFNDMSDAMTDWLTNTKKGLLLNQANNILTLSKIFDWDSTDFTQFNQSVAQYLLPYMPSNDAQYVGNHLNDIKLEYFDYDWTLNGNPPCNCTK